MRVAFLGPEGTFSEEALLANVGVAAIEKLPQATIFDCVMAVQASVADAALVPIENSLEGSVDVTLDTLVLEAEDVTIVGELVHGIEHCLIARDGIGLDAIEKVISHPQATGQCARFLREQLPDVEVTSASSTADAVKIVSESDQPWAALGTRLAASIYGCKVVRDGVEDAADNVTRFVWLARPGVDVPNLADTGRWKTSLVFWGLPDSPGALVGALKLFADRGVNLTKIESRPLKATLGNYMFFADLEGSTDDDPIADALQSLSNSAQTLRVLGSYPAV